MTASAPYTEPELRLLAAKFVDDLLHDDYAQHYLAEATFQHFDFAFSTTWDGYVAAWINRFTDELAPDLAVFEQAVRDGRIRDVEFETPL